MGTGPGSAGVGCVLQHALLKSPKHDKTEKTPKQLKIPIIKDSKLRNKILSQIVDLIWGNLCLFVYMFKKKKILPGMVILQVGEKKQSANFTFLNRKIL